MISKNLKVLARTSGVNMQTFRGNFQGGYHSFSFSFSSYRFRSKINCSIAFCDTLGNRFCKLLNLLDFNFNRSFSRAGYFSPRKLLAKVNLEPKLNEKSFKKHQLYISLDSFSNSFLINENFWQFVVMKFYEIE